MTKLFSEVVLNVLIKPRLMIKCKVVLNCKSVLHGYKVNLNSGFCEHLGCGQYIITSVALPSQVQVVSGSHSEAQHTRTTVS